MPMKVLVKNYKDVSDVIHVELEGMVGAYSRAVENEGDLSKWQIFDHQAESTIDVSRYYGKGAVISIWNITERGSWYKYAVSDSFILAPVGFYYDVATGRVSPVPAVEKVDPLEEVITTAEEKRPAVPVAAIEEVVAKGATFILDITPKFRVFPSILARVK